MSMSDSPKQRERENAKGVPHTYNPGDSVMVEQPLHRKYGETTLKGPYAIDSVNDNGTIRLRLPKGNRYFYMRL
jgi:hypothetical protein